MTSLNVTLLPIHTAATVSTQISVRLCCSWLQIHPRVPTTFSPNWNGSAWIIKFDMICPLSTPLISSYTTALSVSSLQPCGYSCYLIRHTYCYKRAFSSLFPLPVCSSLWSLYGRLLPVIIISLETLLTNQYFMYLFIFCEICSLEHRKCSINTFRQMNKWNLKGLLWVSVVQYHYYYQQITVAMIILYILNDCYVPGSILSALYIYIYIYR